jgi:hypothetical protein
MQNFYQVITLQQLAGNFVGESVLPPQNKTGNVGIT